MKDSWRLHYAGNVAAYARLGDPRVFGLAFALIIGIALVVAVAAGLVDASHGIGLMGAFALAGPTAAVDLREQALAKFLEAKELIGSDGEVTAENLDRFNALMTEAKQLDAEYAKASAGDANRETLRERLEYYTAKATGTPIRFQSTTLDPNSHRSLGEQFVSSDAYKRLRESGALNPGSVFRTDPVIGVPGVRGFSAAADDVIHTESGGSSAPANIRLPGIYGFGAPPLDMRTVFPNDTINEGDALDYAAQTGFSKADGLAVKQSSSASDSAGLKKQSSVKWELKTAHFEWLATWLATTRQALGNQSAIRSFIDIQGRRMIAMEEEDQIVNGNGTRPNLSGILDQDSLQTLLLTGRDNLDGFRVARRMVKSGLSRLTPDFVALNPIDSEGVDLLKDDFGIYRGGNPIGNFALGQPIWGLRRVETEALEPGTALVGASTAATFFERDPLQVLTADQHADFFVRNLVVILFEERVGFPIYFPTAFVELTLADWPDFVGS